MSNILRIKRRVSGGTGAPGALKNAELAFNEVDNSLYYGKGYDAGTGNAEIVVPIGGSGAFVDKTSDQTIGGQKTFSQAIVADITGNAATATALETARTITIAGDVDGSATFDGSANATITVALDTVNSNVGTFGSGTAVPVITVNGKGLVTSVTTANVASSISIAGDTGTDSVSLLTDTLTFTGTGAIDTAVTNNTVSISIVDATTTTKGAASFSSTDFSVSSGAVSLATSGVTAGTYTKITVDAKGRATGGTTLSASDIPTLTSAKISDFDTQVRTSRLDQMAAPTSAVSFNSQRITNVAAPTDANDAVNKAYVDAARQGLDVKDSVVVATTANITLSGLQNIDGITIVAGDRVLVKNQTTGSQNGIYLAAASAWTRATDFDSSAKVTPGAFTFVEQGTVNADSGWVLSNDSVTLGTTALTFTQFSGAGSITAGAGLTKTGNQVDVGTASTSRIVVNADNIDLATIGTAGTYRSVTVDAYGRVSAGTNPTTLSGYGITDAQPLDATLTALAGVTTAANKLIYATGADTFATSDITSFARGLLAYSTAADVRTALELGTMALQAASNVAITGGTIDGITLDGGTF